MLGEIEVVAGGVSEEGVDEMEPAQVVVAAGEESHGLNVRGRVRGGGGAGGWARAGGRAGGCGGARGDLDGRAQRLGQAADLVDEFSDVAKFFVNAGEADVGDLIEVAEALHDALADGAGRDFRFELSLHGVHDVFDEHGDLFDIDGAFVTGGANGANEFFTVEVLAAAVTFDDDDAVANEDLGGAVAVAALETFAAAADGRALLADSGVDHLVLN